MGGRSGQSIARGSAGRAGGFTGAPYSQATITATGLTQLSQQDALQMAGIPPDVKGEVKVTQTSPTKIKVKYASEGLIMDRYIDTNSKEVYNSYFGINNNSRFKGRGLEIFESQVNNLRKKGYKKITVEAAGMKGSSMNGYYTWAVFGYMPNYPQENLNRLNDRAGTNYTNWLDVVRTRSGAALWKEHGIGWYGTFDLSDNSESMKTLRAYSKYRRSQNR